MGDSYTAGVFVGDPQPALDDGSRDGCDRTSDAYPGIVERELAEFPPGNHVHLTNVSCGAATIADIAGRKQKPVSPVRPRRRLVRGGPADQAGPRRPDRRRHHRCRRQQPARRRHAPQVPRTGRGRYVLPRVLHRPARGEESIQDKLARVQNEYIEMLAQVHRAAPDAQVITVGYPAVLPEDSGDCDRLALTELGPVTHADIDWLRDDVLDQLNNTIRRVTSFFGDRYVDVHSSSVGHDACQSAGTKWVEGICGAAEDYWPAQAGTQLDCARVNARATLVHPNAEGHAHTAAHVERAIRIALLER
ncbi:GDSL-type esterase/lipase family protein [Streptomyces nogalater]